MMEIKDLIRLMWRNVLYIVLGLVLGAGVGIAVTKIQTPVYEATTKVFVSRTRQQSNSELLSLTDEQLLAINLQLVKSQIVLNEVAAQMGSKVKADNIQILTLPNTLIIQIKVRDNDPQRAATVANLLAQTLIKQNETLLSGWYTDFETAITEQIAQVQNQIDTLQTQISQISDISTQEQLALVNQQIDQTKAEIYALDQDIASFPLNPNAHQIVSLAEKQAQLDQLLSLMMLYQEIQSNLIYIGKPAQSGSGLENPQLATLQSTLNLYKQINNSLITSRENVRSARTQSKQNVMQIVFATPPKNQDFPIPVVNFLVGSAMGLILAVIAILMTDHLDDSLKSADQIEKLLGLAVLGLVFENKHNKNELVTEHDPFSAQSEAFRALGASLEIIGTEKRFRTVMIVNAEPANARTTIAANLAIINARQGKQVILLDGDLRHPHLHSLFGMENQMGFVELLNDSVDIKAACHAVNDIQGLTLIPSGAAEKELTAWLDVKKWEQLLVKLHKLADLVIVDSPPADVADAQILASKMDAIFLAINAGHTRVDSAQATLKRFQLIDARVAGAVLNRTTQYRKVNKQIMAWFKIKLQKKGKTGEVAGEIDTPAISIS
jgi:capsular exopolysaccharide synthesis family protein